METTARDSNGDIILRVSPTELKAITRAMNDGISATTVHHDLLTLACTLRTEMSICAEQRRQLEELDRRRNGSEDSTM